MGHLKLADKLTLRSVCKEAKQTVDFDSVLHLVVDRAALVTEDPPKNTLITPQWPSPATLQMWGRSVRKLSVGNVAAANELLQKRANASGMTFSEEPASTWWALFQNGQAESEQDEEFDFLGMEGDEEGLGWQGEAQPGVLPAQPALLPAQPGVPPAEPGVPPTQPGTLPTHPGQPPAQPGMLPAQPGSLPAQPGVPPAEPGVPLTHPGTLPTQPGSLQAQLGVPPGQLGLPTGAPQVAPQPSLPNALQHSVHQAATQQALHNQEHPQHEAQHMAALPPIINMQQHATHNHEHLQHGPQQMAALPSSINTQQHAPHNHEHLQHGPQQMVALPPSINTQQHAPHNHEHPHGVRQLAALSSTVSTQQQAALPTAPAPFVDHQQEPSAVHGVTGHGTVHGASSSGHAGAVGLGAAGQGAIPPQATGAPVAAGSSSAHASMHQATQGLRLQKLPILCSKLPQLSTLRLWSMDLGPHDFAAAALCCPKLASLQYLAPPPTARHLLPQGFLHPRRFGWNGDLWSPLSQFPSLRHLSLSGWCFAGSEGLQIGLLTGLRTLEVENCTNQSSDGVGLSCISHLTNLTHLTYSRIRYPHPIPSEFSGLSAIKGLSSLMAIDGDFFPEEILGWADMHLTRLTLSSSYNLTLHGMAVLVPQLRSLVVLEVPDLLLDMRMARGLMHMPTLRDLCVAWIHVRPHHPISQHLELPQVRHLALHHAYEFEVLWEGSIGTILPNIQSLELVARVDVSRASKLAATLFEKPLPALNTLIARATFLTAPEVAAACPAVTSLSIIEAKDLDLCMPLEWRCNITRLALMGSFSGSISQYLGMGSGFHNLRELVLLAFTEEERTGWVTFYSELECTHLKAITLALCPDVGPLHLYSLASQSPNLEEMRVLRCPKVTSQQCQQMVSLLSKPVTGNFWSAETLSEDGCVYAAQQQAAELVQIAGIQASDYTESIWEHLLCRSRSNAESTSARLRAVPFDIVFRDAGSEDALLYEVEGGRHLLASRAWRAVSNHTFYKSSA